MSDQIKTISVPVPNDVAEFLKEEAKRQRRSTRAQAGIILAEHVRSVTAGSDLNPEVA